MSTEKSQGLPLRTARGCATALLLLSVLGAVLSGLWFAGAISQSSGNREFAIAPAAIAFSVNLVNMLVWLGMASFFNELAERWSQDKPLTLSEAQQDAMVEASARRLKAKKRTQQDRRVDESMDMERV